MTDVAAHYLEEIQRQLRGHKRMAEAAIAQLADAELFTQIDPEANSVATLVKHIAGNARSRFTDFLTSDGEKPNRFRDREFEVSESSTRQEIMGWWEEGWGSMFTALQSLKPEDLDRTVTIRQEPHTVMQALNRALAHYAQHIGQIVFLAKHLRSASWHRRSASPEANRKNSRPAKRRAAVEARTITRPSNSQLDCGFACLHA